MVLEGSRKFQRFQKVSRGFRQADTGSKSLELIQDIPLYKFKSSNICFWIFSDRNWSLMHGIAHFVPVFSQYWVLLIFPKLAIPIQYWPLSILLQYNTARLVHP